MRFIYIIFLSLSNAFVFNKIHNFHTKFYHLLFSNLLNIDNKMEPLIKELNELKKEKYRILLNKNKIKNEIIKNEIIDYNIILNKIEEKKKFIKFIK